MPANCPALPVISCLPHLWKTFRSKPNAIPVDTKTVRLPTGIVFAIDRIPHREREIPTSVDWIKFTVQMFFSMLSVSTFCTFWGRCGQVANKAISLKSLPRGL
jgi:hypothetical protein